jgi:hypothetical protein
MNPRSTWFWILVAAALLGAILLSRQVPRKRPAGPQKILSLINTTKVSSVVVRPAGQLEIRADRTNGGWHLSSPLAYPAQEIKITKLVETLSSLTPATQITVAELSGRPRAKSDYGFDPPQAALVLWEGEVRTDLHVGSLTAPGDQLFVQKVGDENIYVVGADLLLQIPKSANDWRDTAFVQLPVSRLSRLTVTNQGKIFALERASNGAPWRLTMPMPVRADHHKIENALENLLALRVQDFVVDKPVEELEAFGLQPPRLAMGLWNDTNLLALLQFGATATNHTNTVFGRNVGLNSVVTVVQDSLLPWSDAVNDYRDPFLVGPTLEPQMIEIRANESFTLQKQGDRWQVQPGDFPVDDGLLKQFLSAFASLRIVGYVKDVVTQPDLPSFGLATPSRQYALKSGPGTNEVLVEVSFGTNQEDRVFAKRTDENSVYTVQLGDLARLPANGWSLRERKLWDVPLEQVTRVTLKQGAAARQMIRNGAHDWALAPGSQGVINELAVEETVRAVCQLSAVTWAGRGDALREKLGFNAKARQFILERKTGEPLVIEFGADAPSTFPYVGTVLNKEFWAFEISWPVYRDILSHLGFPGDNP